MKSKLLLVATFAALLSGCVVNTPTPVTQVSTVPATAMNELWCQAQYDKDGEPTEYLGVAFVRDYGSTFSVINRDGKVVDTSPTLTANKSSAMTGWKNGVMYSKGTGKYTGFYGRFAQAGNQKLSISFDCR